MKAKPGMPDPINKATIARAQAGDADAIGTIYESFHQRIYRFLYYRVGDRQTAEELTSEVFLRMIKALPNYKINQIPIQAWIFQIARNLAVDYYRKSRLRSHAELTDREPSANEDLDVSTDRQLTSELLAAALDELTDEQREVIIFRFVSEMSTAEVAAALDKSEGAVKALQRRGLIALRKVLVRWKVTYG